MRQDKYTLSWHTYSDHLRDILQEIRSDDSFADVTLITDDKKQIKAHRNILSACSSVFKEILRFNANNNHPVIYLRGIQHLEVESILQYIYLGEAKFHEERMHEFFMVAKNLDIRELAQSITSSISIPFVGQSVLPPKGLSPTVGIKNDEVGEEIEDSDCATANGDDAIIKHIDAIIKHNDAIIEEEADDEGKPSRLNVNYVANNHRKAQCQHCDKAYTKNSHLNIHIQSVHKGVKFVCDQCSKQFSEKCSLRRHILTQHEGVKYECNQCGYQANQLGNLSKHQKSRQCMKNQQIGSTMN